MRNIWLVIKHDIGVTLRQRSFWVMTLLVPAFLIALNSYYVVRDSGVRTTGAENDANGEETTPAGTTVIGLVDEAGLIVKMPAGLPPDLFLSFPDETAARVALEAEEIEQYVHIPADHVVTGEVIVYDQNFQIRSSGQNMGVAFNSANEWALRYLIDYNLTSDEQLLTVLRDPVPSALAERHVINPPEETGANDQVLAEVVSSVVPYVYYFLLLMGSNYLMRSVVAEKENRTAEVLLLSLHPRELMVGKIVAMSVAILVQVAVWIGGGVLILNRGADLLNVSQFTFPPGFFVWAILFLILGYLLFASVMATAGAMAPNAREGAQMTWLLVIPHMPTLMFGRLFVEEPDNPLTLGLSLFPFSAPSAMVTRLAVGVVPLWQILVSLAGLAVTTYLFIALAARFFRAGNLLSQASFNWRRLATGWRK